MAASDVARAQHLAAELRVVLGKLKRELRRADSSAGDLTTSQRSVIGRLDREGPATVTQLADGEGVRSQSMGATVAALEAAGLVRGEPHPTDGRRTLLSLTPRCKKLLKDGRAAHEDWLFRAIDTKLAPREQRELATSIALLARLVD